MYCRTFSLITLALTGALAACTAPMPPNNPAPLAGDVPPPPQIGMANPASVFCWQQGGRLRIAKPDQGELTLCVLPNGHQVEEWAFYRGQHGVGAHSTPSSSPPAR